MSTGHMAQRPSARLMQRLEALSGGTDAGNGTPLSAVIASALELDLRVSGVADGSAQLDSLADDDLDRLASDLAFAIATADTDVRLPLGTKFETLELGDIRVGEERWLLDASRPGLHPLETMRKDAHGPNLDLLLSEIQRLTRRSPCRVLGLPAAVRIVDADDHHLLHFARCEEAGGATLQRSVDGVVAPRFCAALPSQILAFAASVVDDMRTFWRKRRAIGKRAGQVRLLLESETAEQEAQVKLVAVDLSEQGDDAHFDMYVHYDAIDDAMRPGRVLAFVSGHYDAYAGVADRRAELAELRLLGADGRIDDMAAAVVAAAPGGSSNVLAKLAEEYNTTIVLPTSGAPMFATLFWRDGTIMAEISMAGRLNWRWTNLALLGKSFPEAVIDEMVGRRVDSFAELPFTCPCVVKSAKAMTRGVSLELEVGERLIDLSSGRIWNEPMPHS